MAHQNFECRFTWLWLYLHEQIRTKRNERSTRPCRMSWTALRTQVRAPGVRRFASKRANEWQEWNYQRKEEGRGRGREGEIEREGKLRPTEWERWSNEGIREWVDQQEHIYYFGIPLLNCQINHHIIEEILRLNQLYKSIVV